MALSGMFSQSKDCSGLRNENEQNNSNSRITNFNLVNKPTTSEVNLIDLLDNVCISQDTNANDKEKQIVDYQLKMVEEFLSTSKQKQEQTEQQETEFRLFFDKYENIKPEPETILQLNYQDLRAFEQPQPKPEKYKECACSFNFDEAPKVLVPKLKEPIKIDLMDRDLEETNEIDLEERELKVNEDLIDEVLLEQVLEKRRLTSRDATFNYIEKKQSSHFDQIHPVDQITEMLTTINSRSYTNNIFDKIIDNNKVKYFETSDNKNIQENTVKVLNMQASTINLEKDIHKANNMNTKSEEKALNNELVTKYDIKYLEAKKKVEKIFQKQSILLSEAEKSKLTPGPSLYEKTVALPQLMECLGEKQITLENKSKMKMRLILDAGTSITMEKPGPLHTVQNTKKSLFKTVSTVLKPQSNIPVLSPPQLLMADCNKKRLQAFKAGKIFNDFVCNGS